MIFITTVTYSNLTPYGKAGISWKLESDQFTMEVIIPVGSEATVYVPSDDLQRISENGKDPATLTEIEFLEMDQGFAVFRVGSGSYNFVVE